MAGFFLTLGSLGLKLIVMLTAKLGSISWASFWPGSLRPWQVSLAYVLLLVPLAKTNRWYRFGIIAICSVVLIFSWMIPSKFPSAELRVTYLDVSQGNSALVKFPSI